MPRLGQTALDDGRRGRHADAERFEHVGAAGQARHRSIAVLGDANAARRDDERRARRDVERARAIAAGAARVEHALVTLRHLHGVRAHRAREADDFRRPLAFHGEPDQQPGDVRRRRAALHHFGHGRRGLIAREVFVPRQLVDERRETTPQSARPSRKFRSMR